MNAPPKKPAKKKPELPPSDRMRVIHEVAGVPASDDRTAPKVDITLPLSELARHIGGLLHDKPLFLMNGRLVLVDEATGEIEEMDAVTFRSWLEEYAVVGKPNDGEFKAMSMSRDTAQGILANRVFHKQLRKLNGVNKVRLPVWANDEQTKVELLPPGYHERSGILTVDLLPYDTGMDGGAARSWLLQMHDECAWAEEGELSLKRSFCAHLACMLTGYCLEMFPPEMERMGFFYTGNQRGIGKSTLAQCALAPVFGMVDGKGYKRNEEAFEKVLDTAAHEGGRYLFLDNVDGKLFSGHLARFITLPRYSYRVLGGNKSGSAENRRVVVMTGNGARAIGDLESRLLCVDLYLSMEALGRKYKRPMTLKKLNAPESRKQFLAALWSLVNWWSELNECARLPATQTRCPEWEAIIGGILLCSHFGNPFAKPLMGMDDQGEAWRSFFVKLAADVESGQTKTFEVSECIDVARENDLLDDMLPEAKDANRAFGHYVKRKHLRGWQFTDEHSRRCEFKKAPDSSKCSRYSVTVFAIEA
ncbi:hypothetical protein [Prosthecobacter sp.]|uniref:hypothetical protein n=1 Tax=Prosthecobacter sp. TaxID=1965333 RepID=UPI002AB9C6B5|nr:hypothetical protein [Prosthecobacter sp.]MDZ4403079.1 hypothetical protein [Prosthecobacter sp.]